MNTELDNQSGSHLVIPSVKSVRPSVRPSVSQSISQSCQSVRLSVSQSVSWSVLWSVFFPIFFAFHESGEGKDSSRTGWRATALGIWDAAFGGTWRGTQEKGDGQGIGDEQDKRRPWKKMGTWKATGIPFNWAFSFIISPFIITKILILIRSLGLHWLVLHCVAILLLSTCTRTRANFMLGFFREWNIIVRLYAAKMLRLDLGWLARIAFNWNCVRFVTGKCLHWKLWHFLFFRNQN